MADNRDDRNQISATSGGLSKRQGDLPDDLQRRYYFEHRGGAGLGVYTDATVQRPLFRDHGHSLSAARTDPNAIRQMLLIAQHRSWGAIVVRGEKGFRREAWLAASLRDIDVLGYKPTERDLQELERRRPAHVLPNPTPAHPPQQSGRQSSNTRERDLSEPAPQSRLKVVETVIRARVADRGEQDRILARARDRLAGWLERGARIKEFKVGEREAHRQDRGRTR